jgi:hypothetical protein
MSLQLTTQLILWFIAAGLSTAAVVQYFAFRKKEDRQSEACKWEDLGQRIEVQEQESARLESEANRARAVIGESVEKSAELHRLQQWFLEQNAELAKAKAERELQESIRAQLVELREEKVTILAALARAQQEKSAEDANISNLSTQRHNLAAEFKGLKNEEKTLKTDIQNQKQDLSLVQSDLIGERAKLKQAKEAIESASQRLSELNTDKSTALTELERVLKEKAAETANIASLATQKANMSAEVARLRDESKSLSNEIPDRKLVLNGILNEINLKEPEHRRLEELLLKTTKSQEAAKLKFEEILGKHDLEKRSLVETQTNHHALDQECIRLKTEIGDLQKWKESLLAMLNRLQADIDRMDPQGAENDRYRDLWEPCTFPQLKLARKQVPELEALSETDRYLKSHGLVYPNRVLHAYHTALKTADMSPLTVLAGISGTGKSLLPKRYSEAMGIHMVSLAVQPRWDSPQDLFGFFNHLEKRFKATELARAMVQFEQFNRDSWALPEGWNHGREDKMLLVLLDEMNLARVEYYFSEFLSRLETRRDVNESIPSDRARADIALDMGSLRKDERSIRIYPGRNVLFTGTMNEDESTQSLSDKVVDRACVLRFGRPKQLEKATLSTTSRSPNEEGLAFKTWMNWCKKRETLTSADATTLNTWIGKLNDGMDALGKPFAHRVHQAIETYVANYPRLPGEDHLRIALADQIEQRILPKLRGIELDGNDEGFRKLKQVIAETSDRALLSAFENGQDSKSGTFHWRGLDRSDG